MICAMYLRKSRADMDAEARGEGETLARHEKTLMELAKARGLAVAGVYRELVSGDTISDRPMMRNMLSAVERGEYDAIICMDIDRLGRGDGSDQALILKTFKYSGTVIITLYKTYDPRTEIDEEYMEFAQFIARGELKRIKRRMWAGRVASAKEGKWQGKVPFGYRRERIENGNGYKLVIDPAEAEAVRAIFEWYNAGIGKYTIAQRIDAMGFLTRNGQKFKECSILCILRNPVYVGKVTWGRRRKQIEMRNGKEVVVRALSENPICAKGLHEAIISDHVWESVQRRLAGNKESPVIRSHTMRNPLAGLLICEKCGYAMHLVQNGHGDHYYRCRTRGCETIGTESQYVYAAVLDTLAGWVEIQPAEERAQEDESPQKAAYIAVAQQYDQLKNQMSRLQDLLETGVYSAETYVERSKILSARIENAKNELARLDEEINARKRADITALQPQIQHILDVWDSSSADEKNKLLKKVVRKIVYKKTKRCGRTKNPADYLSLEIFPIV